MAAINKPFTNADISSRTIATDTTTAATGFGVSEQTNEILMLLKVTARTDGTYTPTIQGSVDNSTWVTLKSGTAVTGVGSSFTTWVTEKDGALPRFVRIAIASASTTSGATMSAECFINKR